MTQTVNSQKNSQPKQNRPGQRQQERLMRQARRRRRQQIWISVAVTVFVIAAAALAYWQYQRVTAQNVTASTTKQKTTTTAQVGPKCATAPSTPAVYASTPKAGPKSPPIAAGVPATNADGLQCLDLKVGSGKVATQGGTLSVEYTGWLESNGKKFDSSYDRSAQAFSVSPLGQANVIQGWNEGLVGMKAGGIRRLVIPASLGYGTQGNQAIPANATLIFDVTVLSVQ